MSKTKYYPWLVCIVCMLMNILACGLVTTAFSTYLPFLRDSLELSYTQTSMINTVRCLVSTASMLFTTQLYKKISIRLGLVLSCGLMILSCVMFANAQGAAMCYAAGAVMGIVFGIGNLIPISIIIRNWFEDQQSTALAIAIMGSSVSTAVFPPIITHMVQSYGLRTTFLAEMIFIAVSMVLIFLVIRDKPEELGLTAFQTGNTETGGKEKKKKVQYRYRSLTRAGFMMLMLASLLVGLTGAPYTAHVSLHLITTGIDPMKAAAALSVFGAVMAVGKIMLGISTDRFGTYRTNFVFLPCLIVGTWMLSAVTASGSTMFPAVVLAGFGLSVGTVGITLWCRDLSSDEEYPERVKLSQTLFSLGGLVATPVPGIIADLTGSYSLAYLALAIIQIVIFAVIQVLYKKNSIRTEAGSPDLLAAGTMQK